MALHLAVLRPEVPGGARVGGGVGPVSGAEVNEGDGLPRAAGRGPSADEQSRGAHEPAAALRGEGALSLAQAEVGGALGRALLLDICWQQAASAAAADKGARQSGERLPPQSSATGKKKVA